MEQCLFCISVYILPFLICKQKGIDKPTYRLINQPMVDKPAGRFSLT